MKAGQGRPCSERDAGPGTVNVTDEQSCSKEFELHVRPMQCNKE